jgi:NAD(P)-dependent dehydrogenase (short-subunit alcohol dehydrogenase family)
MGGRTSHIERGSDMSLLEGKTAVVTGAGRGIGRAHALALAQEGASVLVNDVGRELRGGVGGKGLEQGEANLDVAQSVADEIIANGGRSLMRPTSAISKRLPGSLKRQSMPLVTSTFS